MENEEIIKQKKVIKKNFVFNLTYQLILLIIPIITIPYISRILGSKNIGSYNFALSISTIFSLVASLGTALYGQKQIAICKTKEETSKCFFEITIIRLISFFVAIASYISLIFLGLFDNHKILMLIDISIILSGFFDISWFYLAKENVKLIIARNLLVKILCLILVFVFVKKEDDLPLYTIFMSVSSMIGMFLMWLPLKKYLLFKFEGKIVLKKHFISVLALFIPTIASSIYPYIDKAMITLITNDDSLTGWYSQADTIIRIGLTICATSLSTVAIARACMYSEEQNEEELSNVIFDSLRIVFILAFFVVGLIIICADNFVILFLGDGYEGVPTLLRLLSPLLIIMGITNILGVLFFVPKGKYNVLTICVLITLIVNIALNTLFIIIFGVNGAALASVIAELVLFICYLIYLRNKYSILLFCSCIWKYALSGILTTCSLMWIPLIITNNFLVLLISGVCFTFIYILLLLLLREKNIISVIKKFKNRKEAKL